MVPEILKNSVEIAVIIMVGLGTAITSAQPSVGSASSSTPAAVAAAASTPSSKGAPAVPAVSMSSIAASVLPGNDSAESAQLREQNLLLKEQIKVMREYHSSLLDTVYAAIGVLVAAGGFLLTANLFAGWRMRTSDRAALLSESKAASDRLSLELIEKQAASIANASKQFAERSDSLLEVTGKEISAVRQEISNDRAASLASIVKVETSLEKIKQEITNFQIDFEMEKRNAKWLEATLRNVEANVWKLDSNPVVMLMATCQSISAAMRGEIDHLVSKGVKEIDKIVDRFFSAEPIPVLRKSIREFMLEKLPEEGKYASVTKPARDRISSIRFVEDSDQGEAQPTSHA